MFGNCLGSSEISCVSVGGTICPSDRSSTFGISKTGQISRTIESRGGHYSYNPSKITIQAIKGSQNVGADYLSRVQW